MPFFPVGIAIPMGPADKRPLRRRVLWRQMNVQCLPSGSRWAFRRVPAKTGSGTNRASRNLGAFPAKCVSKKLCPYPGSALSRPRVAPRTGQWRLPASDCSPSSPSGRSEARPASFRASPARPFCPPSRRIYGSSFVLPFTSRRAAHMERQHPASHRVSTTDSATEH